MDEEMERLHSRLYQATGPLGKVWAGIQRYIQGEEEGPGPEEVLEDQNSVIVLRTGNKVICPISISRWRMVWRISQIY